MHGAEPAEVVELGGAETSEVQSPVIDLEPVRGSTARNDAGLVTFCEGDPDPSWHASGGGGDGGDVPAVSNEQREEGVGEERARLRDRDGADPVDLADLVVSDASRTQRTGVDADEHLGAHATAAAREKPDERIGTELLGGAGGSGAGGSGASGSGGKGSGVGGGGAGGGLEELGGLDVERGDDPCAVE